MIDFKRMIPSGTTTKKTNPIEIYDSLDRKSIVGPLRPVQETILNEWFTYHRNDRDLIIKLHTGTGKTLIGLLLLQSMINSKEGPCLYVCPNNYLVQQVCEEAEKFGIPYCYINEKNEIPDDFLSGAKILVVTAQKLFNGKSKFGIGNSCISVGTIVLDDSHACIDVVRDSETIVIKKRDDESFFKKIFELFKDDLVLQGEGSCLDIEDGDYDTYLPVPYWSWIDKKSEFLRLLSEKSSDDSVKFVWPIIKDRIKDFRCFISGSEIEISPYNANADIYGTFSKAKHRVLMSATTQEDAFFIKGLSFSENAVKNPLIYIDQKWAGEKMIIIPSLIDENCDRDLVVTEFSKMELKNFGMVAIVPSSRFVNQYQSLSAICPKTQDIFEKIDSLKKRAFSKIVVFNNRYDGIDLPDEACRILILDSMPYSGRLSDRYEEKCCPNSEIINKKLAQKIEQGLGRGVRGEKDFCVVLIIGSDLVRFVRSSMTKKYFSLQTQKQIDVGLAIVQMAQDDVAKDKKSMEPIYSLIKQMLKRDEGWKGYYLNEMDSIEEAVPDTILYERLKGEAEIEKMYSMEEYEKASSKMQEFIDKFSMDDYEKGWYLQQQARYLYQNHKEESVKKQAAAFKKNSQLLKPRTGVEYTRASCIHDERMKRIKQFIEKYENFNELNMAVNEILDNLSFGVNADKFESALKSVGEMLGFVSQRPDSEIGKGPDNLWCGGPKDFCFFECKSEVEETRNEINKHEAGQMNSHCGWFQDQYNDIEPIGRFLIIATKELSYYANFTHDVRIIRRGKLRKLCEQVKGFIWELKDLKLDEIAEETLQKLIDTYNLNMQNLVSDYSENYYHKKTKN